MAMNNRSVPTSTMLSHLVYSNVTDACDLFSQHSRDVKPERVGSNDRLTPALSLLGGLLGAYWECTVTAPLCLQRNRSGVPMGATFFLRDVAAVADRSLRAGIGG